MGIFRLEQVAAGFAPSTSTDDELVIKCLKFVSLTKKKDNIVPTMKQNHTEHVYFSFFNRLNVTGELVIESL